LIISRNNHKVELASDDKRRNATDPVDQQKWDAVLQGDESQDGRFFYGVRTTGVYCRPSCKSKQPLRKNVEFFNSAEEAEEKGFRTMQRCKPDLSEYDRANPLPDQLKLICDLHFRRSFSTVNRIGTIRYSSEPVDPFVPSEYHTTPTKYLNGLRVVKAAQLLLEPTKSMLQIAAGCGFGSVSSFYSSFKFKIWPDTDRIPQVRTTGTVAEVLRLIIRSGREGILTSRISEIYEIYDAKTQNSYEKGIT